MLSLCMLDGYNRYKTITKSASGKSLVPRLEEIVMVGKKVGSVPQVTKV